MNIRSDSRRLFGDGARFHFEPMTLEAATAIAGWRYGGAYTMYDGSADDIVEMAAPDGGYFAAWLADGTLAGFCCFGAGARVPGGDYADELLDLGLGVHPDLVSQGL